MAIMEGGETFCTIYGHEEILRKSFSPFQKFVREILILLKTWPPWGGGGAGFLHCVDFREILQNFSSLKPLVRF